MKQEEAERLYQKQYAILFSNIAYTHRYSRAHKLRSTTYTTSHPHKTPHAVENNSKENRLITITNREVKRTKTKMIIIMIQQLLGQVLQNMRVKATCERLGRVTKREGGWGRRGRGEGRRRVGEGEEGEGKGKEEGGGEEGEGKEAEGGRG